MSAQPMWIPSSARIYPASTGVLRRQGWRVKLNLDPPSRFPDPGVTERSDRWFSTRAKAEAWATRQIEDTDAERWAQRGAELRYPR